MAVIAKYLSSIGGSKLISRVDTEPRSNSKFQIYLKPPKIRQRKLMELHALILIRAFLSSVGPCHDRGQRRSRGNLILAITRTESEPSRRPYRAAPLHRGTATGCGRGRLALVRHLEWTRRPWWRGRATVLGVKARPDLHGPARRPTWTANMLIEPSRRNRQTPDSREGQRRL